MTNKLLFYASEQYANELIYIFIQLFELVCQTLLCEVLTKFISKECMLQSLFCLFGHK